MARRLRPRGGQESVDNGEHLGLGVHAATNADHLCVVVLAGQCGGLDAPPQRAPYAWHLVGGDLLTITRTAEHDAEAARIGDGALRGGDAERRVVIVGVVGESPTVDRLVAGLRQVGDDRLLEFVTGVVGAEVNAHGRHFNRIGVPRCGCA